MVFRCRLNLKSSGPGRMARRTPILMQTADRVLGSIITRGEEAMKRPLEPSAEGRGRIVGITDGVFAIALTLIVLEIRVPSHEVVHSEGELLAAILTPYWKWNSLSQLRAKETGRKPDDGPFSFDDIRRLTRTLLDNVRLVTGHPHPHWREVRHV